MRQVVPVWFWLLWLSSLATTIPTMAFVPRPQQQRCLLPDTRSGSSTIPTARRQHVGATTLPLQPTTFSLIRREMIRLEGADEWMTHAVSSCSQLLSSVGGGGVVRGAETPISPEPIHSLFSLATFAPQPFWLLLIVLPKSKLTKQLFGGMQIPLLCCLIHLSIVVTSIVTGNGDGESATAPLLEFNNVFDPAGDPQRAFVGMTANYPNFDAEEWSHVLTWDLVVGRYIWKDGLQRNIFTAHSVLLCNLIGPPGLLLHWLTCLLFYGQPIVDPEEVQRLQEIE